MPQRQGPSTLRISCIFLFLAMEINAHPHRMNTSLGSRSTEESNSGSWGEEGSFRSRTVENEESVTPSSNTKQLENNEDIARLIERAYENGDLLDVNAWSNNHNRGSRPLMQRDSINDYQDTGTSFKTQSSSTPANNQQAQRRLFGNPQGSSKIDVMQSDGKIVFPTDDVMIGKPHSFNSRQAPVCQGMTFCERTPYYPEDLVNQAMQLNDSLKFLAGVDVVSEIVQRIDVTDDVPLCVSTEQVVYPKSAENKRKEWLFVVNQENFKQGIRIETCSNENGDCSVIDGLAEGYKTTCKQKYIYRQLAAISSDGKVAPDMFRFPSSCCCHLKFTGNPLTRIGLIGEQRSQTPVPKVRRRK